MPFDKFLEFIDFHIFKNIRNVQNKAVIWRKCDIKFFLPSVDTQNGIVPEEILEFYGWNIVY